MSERETVPSITASDELFVCSIAGGMNTYLRKVWRSKHSFSLWHDIKKRQEKAESDGSVFFHEQTSKRQKMESVNDDLCNFRLAVYHKNNQIRQ